jgi:hypothetical protein
LGWGANTHDWDAIRKDHANKAGLFVPSVIAFLRENNLDGFDIDDESVGYESGKISQTAFNAVIAQLRRALDAASKKDGHAYAFVITPAGNNATKGGIADTNIDKTNARDFDWVNIQSYYGASDEPPFSQKLIDGLKEINYPDKSIAFGVETDETKCNPTFPSPKELEGLKGMFNWNMTADSTCDPAFKYTLQIAKDVGY